MKLWSVNKIHSENILANYVLGKVFFFAYGQHDQQKCAQTFSGSAIMTFKKNVQIKHNMSFKSHLET